MDSRYWLWTLDYDWFYDAESSTYNAFEAFGCDDVQTCDENKGWEDA